MKITAFKYRYKSEVEKANVLYSVGLHKPCELGEMVNRMENAGLKTVDYTQNDLVKGHLRYLIGGRSDVENEIICRFVFPERPGALMKYLDALSPRWNITLFHYRGQGETGANVLVGIHIEESQRDEFLRRANDLRYEDTVESDNDCFNLLMR